MISFFFFADVPPLSFRTLLFVPGTKEVSLLAEEEVLGLLSLLLLPCLRELSLVLVLVKLLLLTVEEAESLRSLPAPRLGRTEFVCTSVLTSFLAGSFVAGRCVAFRLAGWEDDRSGEGECRVLLFLSWLLPLLWEPRPEFFPLVKSELGSTSDLLELAGPDRALLLLLLLLTLLLRLLVDSTLLATTDVRDDRRKDPPGW